MTMKEIDVLTKQRAEELKEQVKSMLSDVNDCLQELNLINEIQRLGVAYHFEAEIKDALHKMYDAHINGNDVSDDLHATALWFRLLRQQGCNVSSTFTVNLAGTLPLIVAKVLECSLSVCQRSVLCEIDKQD
ncbi:beta-cubebene synthase-like [Magnolia sinica]|uniref:beta-cubebene synthase-like n=1 Tax=Magnolia sinica TaxID=86752 RepID=UPI0026596147|nr:beta-cubebene synthase-like [Magnolia sinica]